MAPSIQFSKLAYAKMMLHASTHSQTPIHGILLGQITATATINVTDAIPVSHSTPTKPLIDMALRIAQVHCQDEGGTAIVGWYTANERVGDDTPSPVAWKMVQNLTLHRGDHGNGDGDGSAEEETKSSPSQTQPILAIVTSESFETMLRKDCSADGSGKGFDVYRSSEANHAVVPLEDVSVEGGEDWGEVSAQVADVCLSSDDANATLCDFETHLDGGVHALKDHDWFRNAHVAKLI